MTKKPTLEQIQKSKNPIIHDRKEYSFRPNGTIRVRSVNTQPTKTQQQFKNETDANLIVKKYHKNLHLERFNEHPDMYRNLSQTPTYLEALSTVRAADSAFESLPSNIRLKFENNPEKLLQFVHDEKNHDEGVKLGIFKSKPTQISTSQPNEPNEPNPPTKKSKSQPPSPTES